MLGNFSLKQIIETIAMEKCMRFQTTWRTLGLEVTYSYYLTSFVGFPSPKTGLMDKRTKTYFAYKKKHV